VRAFRYPVGLAVVVVLCVLTAWAFSWPFTKAVTLAPVIVCGGAALVGLVLLWGKIAWGQLRESRHPRRLAAYWLIGLVLLVVLTVLGVKLPSEGGH
jgi:heme/copper-type cytochrome/quinol oxidase subunit 4